MDEQKKKTSRLLLSAYGAKYQPKRRPPKIPSAKVGTNLIDGKYSVFFTGLQNLCIYQRLGETSSVKTPTNRKNFWRPVNYAVSEKEIGRDNDDKNDKDDMGDTADRATVFTGQWVPLGCNGMYWAVLVCSGLYWVF